MDTLQEHLGTMRLRCDEAQAQLQETNEACKSLLDRAGNLREQRFVPTSPPYQAQTLIPPFRWLYRQALATRHSIVSLFLARFTLSEEDRDAITSREVPVGKKFFEAMDKAERIREDCRVLMIGEEGSTKAGYVWSLLNIQHYTSLPLLQMGCLTYMWIYV